MMSKKANVEEMAPPTAATVPMVPVNAPVHPAAEQAARCAERTEIGRALALLSAPGDVVELRVPKTRRGNPPVPCNGSRAWGRL